MIVSLDLPSDVADALDAAAGREKLAPTAFVLKLLRDRLGVTAKSARLPQQVGEVDHASNASRAARIREQAVELSNHFNNKTS